MNRYLVLLFLLMSSVLIPGEKESSGGDPLIEEFYHRSLYAMNAMKKGLVSGRLATTYEEAHKDLRVDITDSDLLTTGRILPDPKRPGKRYVLLDRNKFFKLLVNGSGDITAFVVHEGLSTKGLDINYEITRSIHFNEEEYQRWKIETTGLPRGHSESSAKVNFDTLRQIDSLDALWSRYKYNFIKGGRVVSLDEGGITTSEGQGYALLRAVWSDDRETFDTVWKWTEQHLQVRSDKAFAWKWNGAVVDKNNASDADSDIALALILASRRFKSEKYNKLALEILNSLWKTSVVEVKGQSYLTAGNWAKEKSPYTIHLGYLAPYAYEVFSTVDYSHPWKRLVASSYRLLHYVYDEKNLPLPPERIYLNKDGKILLSHPDRTTEEVFGYDTVPLFWRLAMDKRWHLRRENDLCIKALSFFTTEWENKKMFKERYHTDGTALSSQENLPLYTTVFALASEVQPDLANKIYKAKIYPMLTKATDGSSLPYYLHNWLWFSSALNVNILSAYDEILSFLRPFDFHGFLDAFPYVLFSLMLISYFLRKTHVAFFGLFLSSACALCIKYLWWRATDTLNFIEPLGPFISISLLLAEAYGFSTVLLLMVQVGFNKPEARKKPDAPDFQPSVDIYVPIFTEPLEILERTLIGCKNIAYSNVKIYVLDDGHREEVKALCDKMSVRYILGPKKHAKAGNLNNAFAQTTGDLVLVFDTDHIPTHSFLEETVPFFIDERIGFVQTPHHFYNEDIFQKAFRTSAKMPNEQDMFNHAIQAGRDTWGGAFFVGSGALFRRKALESVGGFKCMSITEDIHTSQYLHAAKWKSVFVDKDLAVGLTAENFASHTIQRRRWMLGCLQIFFKDNPLFCKGLSIQHRIGYFASHYYFLFPVFRIIFFLTPLYYLFFHLHPVFSDVSVLVARLIPFMVTIPLLTNAVVPGWPRFLWGTAYEYTVCFSLFRSLFDLVLPKSLGFKVTPKGITSHKREFDKASSKLTLIAAVIVAVAIGKGLFEFYYFGIEKDAYFFNLGWALINLFFTGLALLVAWERPQRREEFRIKVLGAIEVQTPTETIPLELMDVSLNGVGFRASKKILIPKTGKLLLTLNGIKIEVQYELVRFKKKFRKGYIGGMRFMNLTSDMKNRILQISFAHPKTWENAHGKRSHSNFAMGTSFLKGVLSGLMPEKRSAPAGLILLLCLYSLPVHASLKESWYLSRGRSNMEIKNYRAAIEAYENAAKINPDNLETTKILGIAYEAQGLRDKSIAAFDKYLDQNPDDYDIAFKQAQTLGWSRYAYREQDALKYYRMGLSRKNDARMRIKYATILARRKETNNEAIEQFKKVLDQSPRNREAHIGLARAYAWNGHRDLAAYHASQVSDGGASEIRALKGDLKRGHEPEVAAVVDGIYQPNSVYQMDGFSIGARGRHDVGPFLTFKEKVAWDYYTGNGLEVSGPLFDLAAQYRASEDTHLNAILGYRSMTANRGGDILFNINGQFKNGNETTSPGFERVLLQDSLIAYAGKNTLGKSRLYNLYTEFRWDFEQVKLSVKPFLGLITSASSPVNFRIGSTINVSYLFSDTSDWQIATAYRANFMHYGKDHSASIYRTEEPYGDAYFSPRLYLEQAPLLQIKWKSSERQTLGLEAGPAFQIIHQYGQPNAFQVGLISNGSLEYQASQHLFFWIHAGYTQASSVYSQVSASSGCSYLF